MFRKTFLFYWGSKYWIVSAQSPAHTLNFLYEIEVNLKSNFSIVSGTSNIYSVAFSIRLAEKKEQNSKNKQKTPSTYLEQIHSVPHIKIP